MPEHVGFNPDNPASWSILRNRREQELNALPHAELLEMAQLIDRRVRATRTTEELVELILVDEGLGWPADVAQVDEAWSELPDDKPALLTLAKQRKLPVRGKDAEALIRTILESRFGPELVALYYECYA